MNISNGYIRFVLENILQAIVKVHWGVNVMASFGLQVLMKREEEVVRASIRFGLTNKGCKTPTARPRARHRYSKGPFKDPTLEFNGFYPLLTDSCGRGGAMIDNWRPCFVMCILFLNAMCKLQVLLLMNEYSVF